jgi:hypothetical protein
MTDPTGRRAAPASDLASEDVRRLAAAIGLAIADEDLADVTFRLNATLEHLAVLDALEPRAGATRPLSDAPEG